MKACIFIGSLKANPKNSNTVKTCLLLKKQLETYGVAVKSRYLRRYRIAPGVEFDTGDSWDEFAVMYQDVAESNIIVLATPVWWGVHSSLCQAWMERIGAYDDAAIATGKTPLYNKVFGCVITASNDGFQHVHGTFNAFAANLGMTCPPENHVYWGTVLKHSQSNCPSGNDETVNQAKNCARNLYLWAQTIEKLDLGNIAQQIKPGRVGLLSNDQMAQSTPRS